MSLALLHGMRAMKPNVVLLSRNASSSTASKIRLLLYPCVNIKRKLPHSQIMRYTTIKTLELVAHLYRNALLESCTMMQPEISVLSSFSLSRRVGRGISTSKAFTTDPLTTAIFLPRLMDILFTMHVSK